MRVKGCAQSCPQSLTRFISYSRLLTLCGASLKMQIAMQGSYRQGTCFLGHHPRNADSAWCWAANTRVRSGTRGRCYELTREGRSEGHLLESKRSTTASQRELCEDIETVSMQADKLSKGAPGHPTNAHESQPVKTDIPNGDVSRKQSEMQKHNPVPTQIKQGSTVTLKQVHLIILHGRLACRHLCTTIHNARQLQGAQQCAQTMLGLRVIELALAVQLELGVCNCCSPKRQCCRCQLCVDGILLAYAARA